MGVVPAMGVSRRVSTPPFRLVSRALPFWSLMLAPSTREYVPLMLNASGFVPAGFRKLMRNLRGWAGSGAVPLGLGVIEKDAGIAPLGPMTPAGPTILSTWAGVNVVGSML